MSKDNGGHAFPGVNSEFIDHPVHGRTSRASVGMEAHPGMTLRDWFAGQALAGLFADRGVTGFEYAKEAADTAYELADAMLAERAKGGDA